MPIRIALVIGALIAPMVLLAVHFATAHSEQDRIHTREKAASIAKAVGWQYADLLSLAKAQMERVGVLLGRDVSQESCNRLLAQTLRVQPLFIALYVADTVGDLICSARPVRKNINIADREYFQRALKKKRFVVSSAVQSRDTGEWTVVAAQPLPDEERVALGTLDLARLQDMLDNFQLAPGALISIVDRSGHIIARAPYRAELLGKPVLEADKFIAAISAGDEGYFETISLDGVPSLIAFARVPGQDAYVRVGIPDASIASSHDHVLYVSLGGMAVAVLLALLVGLLTFRKLIGDPIRALTDAAEKLGAGNLAARTRLPHDESIIGSLATKLDELAAHGQRKERALRARSNGNRTLLRERNEIQLLHAMCKVAVESAGYAVAYVCFPRHDAAKSINFVARHGDDGGFAESAGLTWSDTARGQSTIARCIRSGQVTIARMLANDDNLRLWRRDVAVRGFASSISLPLRVNGVVIGTFTLIAREEDAFDDEEVELLDEMAADLSFGTEGIRAESRRKEAEQIARRALTHDSVVDLPSRAAFLSRVNECIERARGNREPVVVLDVHLGRLQDIFDSFGYEHGNAVLREIAERLKKLPGTHDGLGRLPVEDFGIVLCGHDADAAEQMGRAALATFARLVQVGEARIDVRASIGVSLYPGHGEDAEALVRRASIAARDGFRKDLSYCVYAGATERENPARLSLAADLRAAVEARELVLHYQPKVRLADWSHCGSEALARWKHPVRGLIPPMEFISLAEEIGLMGPLTYQVVDMAVRQQHEWLPSGATPVAINLSARNLYDPALFKALDGFFATGVPRDLIHFEITESALVDDPEAARRALLVLRDQGAKIYIDDFGTGYSSLSYLVRLPVHALKIDRSFIHQMAKSVEARSVVASIISMAHNLNMKVVAEGVETSEDFGMLHDMGCDEAQGYFIAPPLDARGYEGWRRSK
jgi:diguanylate cyclase (GGDEF)-like protein